MPTMTFRLPADLPASAAADLRRTSVAGGHDRAPTASRCQIVEGHLVVGRELNESGPLYVPWDVPGVGRVMTTTTSLMFRGRPYHLVAELARGKLNQVRNQYADWVAGGLEPSAELEALLHKATHSFGKAALGGAEAAADPLANATLADAHRAADLLVQRYQDQVFRLRHQRQGKFEATLGCRVTSPPPPGVDEAYRLSFNAVCIPMTWRDVEPIESDYRWEAVDAAVAWAVERDLRIVAGPLIDFRESGLPDFVKRLGGDPVCLKSLMCDYVETAVNRYRGKVSRWLVATGSNGTVGTQVGEEDLIRLTAMAADAAWQIDSSLPVSFGVVDPWGDYLTEGGFEYSPFVFADTLVRSGLPFAGIDLEWHLGTSPGGSYCRDLLEASRLLDMFGMLGIPLHLSMGYPSSDAPDDRAGGATVGGNGACRGFTPPDQAAWASAYGELAFCKAAVAGVMWDHLLDADPHRVPHGGLIDATGHLKPAFDRLRLLREEHLR